MGTQTRIYINYPFYRFGYPFVLALDENQIGHQTRIYKQPILQV